MKVAEYVAQFLSEVSPRVYGICGAGAMHLNDAIANHPGIKVITMQNEQAAAMAAEADARVTGGVGIVSVTTGPGGTNAATGIGCAYVDSIPMLVIAGQVTTSTMIPRNSHMRQVGMNELDVVSLMKPITKYAATVREKSDIRLTLEYALHVATHGRKGPVFIEIPLDIQAADVDPDQLRDYKPLGEAYNIDKKMEEMSRLLLEAERPLVIVGNGVRMAKAETLFYDIFNHLDIPIVSSWGAADIVPSEHDHYVGRCGIFGDRASNFAVQSADLILCIGTRLSVAQIGHSPDLFAPKAKKIIVDIERQEVYDKPTVRADLGIVCDAKFFLEQMNKKIWPWQPKHSHHKWLRHCQTMKEKYKPKWQTPNYGISSYGFVESLCDHLESSAVVVTDVGFCFIPTFQTMRLLGGQRLIHSAGVSPMGWGIPASIGAAMASDKQVVCLTGDGGAMMNLQELQTIAHHRLPIAIFVYENGGYATMKIAQNNHFKREVMAGPKSGLTLPNFIKVAQAFGIYTMEYNSLNMLNHAMENILDISRQGPIMVVMHMSQDELIMPRLMARMQDGKFLPAEYADLWPHLPRGEYAKNLNAEGESDDVERLDGIR